MYILLLLVLILAALNVYILLLLVLILAVLNVYTTSTSFNTNSIKCIY